MNAKEFHIGIEQGLQKHNSFVFDDYFPEEIDFVLDKVTKRFIDDKFRKDKGSEGHEIQQGDYDDVQFMIEKDIELPAFLDTINNAVYTILPSNYLNLISDRARINDNCKIINFTASESYEKEYTTILELADSAKGSAPFYDVVTITLNGNEIFTIENFTISSGLPSVNHKFLIKNIILDELRQNLPGNITGVYWENYRGKYTPDSFIFVSDIDFTGTNAIDIDGTIVNATTEQVTGLTVSVLDPTKQVPNRLNKSGSLHKVLNNNVYFKTHVRSPVSDLAKDKLFVYYNKRFIPTSIIIDYIRIPRKISLALNRTCELSESTHERIVDLAVEYIKNTIEQRSYESKLKDNLLRSE